jgi:hypothetical protein
VKPLRFARSARKHRIGRASARHVIDTSRAERDVHSITGETLWSWEGDDERGRELEIVAVEKADALLVIHVMPTHYRRKP